jgi:hypothetical protein
MKSKLLALFAIVGSLTGLNAGSVALNDADFTFQLDGATLPGGLYEVRWGSFASGVFSPFYGNLDTINNGAYIDTGFVPGTVELIAALTAGDNSVTGPANTQLYLSFSTLSDDSDYAGATNLNSIVLTDPTWVAGTFTLLGPDLQYSFSSSTTVSLLAGQNPATSFSFNGGNEVINIVSVPEPSTYAALAGVAVLGLAALRRRRA